MYLLFLPLARGANVAKLLAAAGLTSLAPEGGGLCLHVDVGPTGDRGVLISFGDPIANGQRLSYSPDVQVWRESKPAGRYWLGKNTDLDISPASLLREKHQPGQHVTLDDGHDWLIPIARQLPHKMGIDANGDFCETVKPAFADFYAHSEAVFQALINNQGTLTKSDALAFAVEALAINYRVNADVCDFLHLIDRENLQQILGATIEVDLILTVEAQKKTAEPAPTSATCDSSSGSDAAPASNTTSPPGSTSTS